MNKFVLTEFLELSNDSSLLTEQQKKAMNEGEEFILAGVMQRADAENGNGRIYPLDILEREDYYFFMGFFKSKKFPMNNEKLRTEYSIFSIQYKNMNKIYRKYNK